MIQLLARQAVVQGSSVLIARQLASTSSYDSRRNVAVLDKPSATSSGKSYGQHGREK
jgi:hypothetical protein